MTADVVRVVRRGMLLTGYLVGLGAQLIMIALGIGFLVTDDPLAQDLLLLSWCLVGTAFLLTALIVLGWTASRPEPPADQPVSRLDIGTAVRRISFIATVLASLVGGGAAATLLGVGSAKDKHPDVVVLGVWAMLLAWGFLHWGFAQLYRQSFYAAAEPPLRFPNTTRPRSVDFAYFAFTLGTSFAASDVEVLTTRLRWTVLWHSVLSFFFNGFIIVLALNTISGS